MNRFSVWVGLILISALIFCGSAAAYNITDSSVSNTNVYAGSSVSTFGPADTYDPASCTSEGMTFDSGIYVRPVDLTVSVSKSVNALFSTFTQGALVTVQDGAVVSTPYKWDFGNGKSAETYEPQAEHTYHLTGEYSAEVTVSNYLDGDGESATVILYAGYESYQSGWMSVLSLIIVAALIVTVVLLFLVLRGGVGLPIIIPFAAGMLGLVIVFTFIAFMAGTVDNLTMGILGGT